MVTSISEVLMFSQLSSQRQKGQMKPPRSLPWMRSRTDSATRLAPVELVPTHFEQTSPILLSLGPPQRTQRFPGGAAFFFRAAIEGTILTGTGPRVHRSRGICA